MFLAVTTMDPGVQAFFYAVAVGLFILAAFGVDAGRMALLPLGLAFFVFPSFWNALAGV